MAVEKIAMHVILETTVHIEEKMIEDIIESPDSSTNLPMQYMVADKDAQGRALQGAKALPIRLNTIGIPPKDKK